MDDDEEDDEETEQKRDRHLSKREKREMAKRRKKEIRERREKKERNTKVLIGVGLIALIVLIGYGLATQSKTTQQQTSGKIGIENSIVLTPESNGTLKIAKSEVSNGKINYFLYNDIIFFVHYNPNGNYKTRVSECALCGNRGDDSVAKKGFTLQNNGNTISCNACGTTWDREDDKGISGGCQNYPPSYVKNTQDNDYIYINKEDVKWYQ